MFKLLDKLGDWLPGRGERRRNQIIELRRKYDEIIKRPYTPDNGKRLDDIAVKLRKLEQEAING